MSAFLGPIHSWLYNKIIFQDKMAESIVKLAKDKGWNEDSFKPDRFGILESGDLADIVDPNNIHGWLQERVNLVENKLAYVVTFLTENHKERLDEMNTCIYRLGEENVLAQGTTVKEAYLHLENLLLNGMPCDRVNEIVKEQEDCIIWRQTQDIHEKYWDMVNGDKTHYTTLRNFLIKGIMNGSGIEYMEKEDHKFELVKVL